MSHTHSSSSEVSVVAPCTRKVRITIDAPTIAQELQEAWRDAQKNVRIKGFRPGKTPLPMLQRKYGDAIRHDVKRHLIQHAYGDAIKEHGLHPVESPQVDFEKIDLDAKEGIELELVIDVRPEFEVPDYKGVEVGAPSLHVAPEDVDRQIEALRERLSSYETVGDGVIGKDDLLRADVSYQVDGAIVVHHEDTFVDLRGDVIDKVPAGGATTSFLGQRAGNTVTVQVELPADFEPAGFAGARAHLLCTVKEIQRVTMPPLDDALASRLGAKDVAELRDAVEKDFRRHVETQRNQYIEERLFDELIRRVPFDLPERLLERMTQLQIDGIAADLVRAGTPEAEAKARVGTHADKIREEQARRLRVSFLVDRIAAAEKIGVSDAELEAMIRHIARVEKADPQAVYDDLVESGRIESLRSEILDKKVRALLREAAKVTEAAAPPAKD